MESKIFEVVAEIFSQVNNKLNIVEIKMDFWVWPVGPMDISLWRLMYTDRLAERGTRTIPVVAANNLTPFPRNQHFDCIRKMSSCLTHS